VLLLAVSNPFPNLLRHEYPLSVQRIVETTITRWAAVIKDICSREFTRVEEE
jgi:hypothetical protein